MKGPSPITMFILRPLASKKDSTETYERLDKFLFELAQKRRNLKVSRNDAIEALLDEHYQKGGKS